MSYETKLQEMGLELPPAPKPVAAYIPAIRAGQFIYTSGQLPFVNGELRYQGKVGGTVSENEAYEASKICALNCLSVIKAQLGSLDRIKQIIKVTVFVSSAPGFNKQPQVANGASEFLFQLFGEAGQHTRSAVGVNELPLDAVVEVEMIVQVEE